jgi:hypothetical protein
VYLCCICVVLYLCCVDSVMILPKPSGPPAWPGGGAPPPSPGPSPRREPSPAWSCVTSCVSIYCKVTSSRQARASPSTAGYTRPPLHRTLCNTFHRLADARPAGYVLKVAGQQGLRAGEHPQLLGQETGCPSPACGGSRGQAPRPCRLPAAPAGPSWPRGSSSPPTGSAGTWRWSLWTRRADWPGDELSLLPPMARPSLAPPGPVEGAGGRDGGQGVPEDRL